MRQHLSHPDVCFVMMFGVCVRFVMVGGFWFPPGIPTAQVLIIMYLLLSSFFLPPSLAVVSHERSDVVKKKKKRMQKQKIQSCLPIRLALSRPPVASSIR